MPKQGSFYTISGENGESTSRGEMGQGRAKKSGCFVSVVTGFVLTLLAILIAVGVGLIVHFAEKDSKGAKDISCGLSPESMAEFFRQMQQAQMTGSSSEAPSPSSTTLRPTDTEDDSYRLPSDLQPLHYDLELAPDIYGSDPSAFSFRGHVNISFQCLSPTNKVVLNAKNLSISKTDIEVSGSAGRLEVVDMLLNDRMETLKITLGEGLRQGETYTVYIAFSGPLTDDLAGLYLGSYKRGNDTVYVATTQFESPDAREAFPCFDEPAFKANFSVTLLRKPPMVSLSNTPVKHSLQRPEGWVADVYETTPRMSTYLLAFVVCDFVHITGTTGKGTQFGIWARRELADRMDYALKTGMVILDYYADLFGTDFPLQKQDMIAMPDFAAGAMENWGLIIYREKYLLYKENVTSEAERQRVTLVIAHELAHQWFGNLVTLAWWDDLWLNEGFAEFVEYIGMNRIDPDWKMWEQFNIDVVQYVFNHDQIKSSHPLFTKAKTVNDMEQYFDSISYEKGASVIRMMEFCLGENTFRRGLQRYLRTHQFGNAEHKDLWNALTEQTKAEHKDLDIADIMNTWTLQMGFPVVTVTRNFQGHLVVSQKRFLINPDAKDPGVFSSDYGYQWHVPITLTSSAQPLFNVTEDNIRWLSKDEQSKTLAPWVPMPGQTDTEGWFLVNVQQKGYYRVNYDHANWMALINQLKKNHKVISAVNRAQIINDAWNLASAEELSTDIALSTLEYLEQEEDYVPWAAASIQLGKLKTRMTGTSGYGALSRFIQDKIRPLFAKLGLDDTGATALESLTRTIAVGRACGSGLTQCLQDAVQLFKQWRQNPSQNPISPSVRERVYCIAVKEGDEADWLFVLTQFRQEESPVDKDYLMHALTCTTRPWLLNTLLNMALSGADIRRGNALSVIAGVATNDVGTRLAWDFVRANWNIIIRDFAQSNSRLNSMINGIVNDFRTDLHLQELQDFIHSLGDLGRAERVFSQAVEKVEFNVKWYKNSYPAIVRWLEAHGYKEFEGTEATNQQTVVTPENVRLPTNLRPLHYDLTLEPNMYGVDPSTFTYNGTVALTFHCVEATDRIVMHMKELHVSHIQLLPPASRAQGNLPRVLDQKEDKDLEFLILLLDAPLSAGLNYTVSMDVSAPLDSVTLSGFYLSSFVNTSGQTEYLATTQFEPTDARRAFPCMDEPALKASFTIRIVRRTFNFALSNMPVKDTRHIGEGRVMDEFQTSRPMSTYLVAFVVCNFGGKTQQTSRNVRYEVWSRKEAMDQNLMDFALDFGVKAIDFYEDYFQVNFPLPKQSMIAIPDIAGGAMENWGLITYRETSIMLPPGQTSILVAQTVAHELGHMWFGDLVSPEWWDELWLNEGFATFLSYLTMDYLRPDWKQFESFVTNVIQPAMHMDGKVSSHPVYVPVATPAEINEIFDSISYSKGASIIRMIRFAIGEDTFKRGLKNYLNTLKFKSASHDDLWKALDNEAAKDRRGVKVGEVMDTWTLQMNYPVVVVSVEGQKVTLTQQRFRQNPTAVDPGKYQSKFGYKWDIPFTFTTRDTAAISVQASDVHWLMRNETSKVLTVPALNSGGWLLGNVGVMGYYRVNYDNNNWAKLATQLMQQPTAIGLLNRAQIIDDAWSLASGGYITQDIALNLMDYLDKESEYVPWVAAYRQLSYMGTMLSSTQTYGAFKIFMANKTSTQYNRFGMTSNVQDFTQSQLKSLMVQSACNNDGARCVQDALTLFRAWKISPYNTTIPGDVRSTVYCTALRHGSMEDWQFLYDRFLKERDVGERDRLQRQLACTSRLWQLRKLLNSALYSGDFRSQDALDVLGDVTYNPAGTTLAWEFVRASWDDIMQRYRTDPFSLKRLIGSFGSVFSTPIQLQEMQAFVDSHPDLGVATRAFQAALESTRANIHWKEKNYDIVRSWLGRQGFPV